MTNRNPYAVLAPYIGAILSTLAEAGSAPSGICYAALMGRLSLGTYQQLIGAMVEARWLTLSDAHVLAITDAGRKMSADLEAAVAARKEAL